MKQDGIYIPAQDGGQGCSVYRQIDKSFRVVKYHRDNRGMVWKMDTEEYTYIYYQVYWGDVDNRKMKVFRSEEKLILFVKNLTKHDLPLSHKFLHPVL